MYVLNEKYEKYFSAEKSVLSGAMTDRSPYYHIYHKIWDTLVKSLSVDWLSEQQTE